MPDAIAPDILPFFLPNDPSCLGAAPRGAALDNLRRPLSLQELHEAGEAEMMRLFEQGHRKALKPLVEKLDDRRLLEQVEARHREEFYERRLGAPLSELHRAVVVGDAGQTAVVSSQESCKSIRDDALHLAAVEGSAALIDVLLSHGALISSVNRHGLTAAHIAAAAGNHGALEALLLRGADPSAKDRQGATPLMLAIGAMSTSCAELLLPMSAPNARDLDGREAKDYAPRFHADPDDPGFDDALRFARLLQSLEEASALGAVCNAAGSAKARAL